MKKIITILLCSLFCISLFAQNKKTKEKVIDDRTYWTNLAYKMAAPVLSNMSKGELKKNMQVELSPTWDGRNKDVTYMECFRAAYVGDCSLAHPSR